jgi:VCBS repeat-containing protein
MLHAAGVLSGSVYFDMDGDGTRDASERGVPGAVVRLTDSNSDSSMDWSTITDDNGIYTFDELEPDTHQISKRHIPATIDGDDSTSVPAAVSSTNLFSNLVLADDQNLGGNNFGEQGLRAQFISYAWFTTFRPLPQQFVRETIALSEELAGNSALATSIRSRGGDVPDDANNAPIATDDLFSVDENGVLTIAAASGVLANDIEPDGDPFTATLVGQASNGFASLDNDGSFTYKPDAEFSGTDSFTYQTSDGTATSNLATVTINVNRTNQSPVATDDAYTVDENGVLTIAAASGVLANDTDPDADTLVANSVEQPANGSVTLNPDGSFTYTPENDFSGDDSFTYRATDGGTTSDVATVRITVTPVDDGNQLFGAVTPGSFTNPSLLGIRTDLVSGAPPITASHVDGDIDYTGYSNPPTYGAHHGFDPQGIDVNPGITPRPTGVYTTEQPEEDLIHNMEHGHVWISYNPNLIAATDLAALEQLVRDGSPDPNGGGVGVILTPRAANDTMIALASWARLLPLDNFDATTIRNFVETNRGQAPEGFITP